MAIDIRQYEEEILHGLQNEQGPLDEARTNLQVFHGVYEDAALMRLDADGRSRRDIPLMSRVIDLLTAYAYQDPPSRRIGDEKEATFVYERIIKQTNANARLRASDRHRHAANVAAIQVHATGNTNDPIRLYNWTADSIVTWQAPDDQTVPIAVCTIDRFDETTRYRLWTADECRTYSTKKLMPLQTAGGRVASFESSVPNPYGTLPFVFMHFQQPVTQFDEGGIGTDLSRLERMLNYRFFDSADNLRHSKPLGLLLGMDADDNLPMNQRPGTFKRFKPCKDKNITQEPENIEAQWIAPPLDWVEAEWTDIRYHWNYMLECVGVPSASLPIDKAIIATESGAALVARQIPLFVYARKTQELYRGYEEQLAKLIFIALNVFGGGYDELLKDFSLAITWGEVVPDMPPDSPDDYLDGQRDRGELSEVMVIMKKFGITREEAIEHLTQVAEDEATLRRIRTRLGVQEQPQEQTPLENIVNSDEEV